MGRNQLLGVYGNFVTAQDLDPYTVSLLHFDGVNGSTTFTCEKGKTWTAGGNAKLSTTTPKFGSACGTFDGTGDYITTGASADWNFGTGDYTVELQFRSTQTGRIDLFEAKDVSQIFILLFGNNIYEYEGSILRISGSVIWNDGNWHHLGIARASGSTKMFFDGNQIGSTYVASNTINMSAAGIDIGINIDHASYPLLGQLDELRISKGVARWTSNFTPPDAPYTIYI